MWLFWQCRSWTTIVSSIKGKILARNNGTTLLSSKRILSPLSLVCPTCCTLERNRKKRRKCLFHVIRLKTCSTFRFKIFSNQSALESLAVSIATACLDTQTQTHTLTQTVMILSVTCTLTLYCDLKAYLSGCEVSLSRSFYTWHQRESDEDRDRSLPQFGKVKARFWRCFSGSVKQI